MELDRAHAEEVEQQYHQAVNSSNYRDSERLKITWKRTLKNEIGKLKMTWSKPGEEDSRSRIKCEHWLSLCS